MAAKKKEKKEKPRTVEADDGRVFTLAPRRPTGRLLPCPGEAHGNPFIDNCMLCAPRWGEVAEYEPPRLADVTDAGLAVQVAATREGRSEWNEALVEGRIAMVHVTETRRTSRSSYYVYVCALLCSSANS